MVSKPGCPSVFGCLAEICIFEISLGDSDGQCKKVRHLGALVQKEPILLHLFKVPAHQLSWDHQPLLYSCFPSKGKTSKLHLSLEKQTKPTFVNLSLYLVSLFKRSTLLRYNVHSVMCTYFKFTVQ